MVKPKIFVSYSSKDQMEADNLAEFLDGLGVRVIIDKGFLRAPNPIGEKLLAEIRNSHGCIWVLTENSLKSEWCPLEVGAFWGAGKPVIIYNPSDMTSKPFHGIVHAKSYPEIKRAIKGWELQGKPLATVTVQEIEKLIKKNVESAAHDLSEEVMRLREHLPVLKNMMDFVGQQNTPLPGHDLLLSRITEILELRKPRKLTCAFDVPSFGSVSAESEYLKCCDAFNKYVTNEQWDMTIYLLPADMGKKIVNIEYPSELEKQKEAWGKDIGALRRFQWYEEHANERGQRKFKIGWLAINRDVNGVPSGWHSMPLNIWLFDDSEAVFSTVIDNYKPTSVTEAKPRHRETGFSTTNSHMLSFLNEIIEKYAENIDETVTLDDQIAASEEEKSRIERSMSARDKTDATEE